MIELVGLGGLIRASAAPGARAIHLAAHKQGCARLMSQWAQSDLDVDAPLNPNKNL